LRGATGPRTDRRSNRHNSERCAETGKSFPFQQPTAIKQPTPERELQLAVSTAGNDRAMLGPQSGSVFLNRHPESENRSQIYRPWWKPASSCANDPRAPPNTAERIVALNPNDIPLTMLTISFSSAKTTKLRSAALSVTATRVIDFVTAPRPPTGLRASLEEQWQREKKTIQASRFHSRKSIHEIEGLAPRSKISRQLSNTPTLALPRGSEKPQR